ncbi:methyl-coenzyme M reductase operon protein D [Methanobacterium alcaliphilum]|uniref:methyl-coenzyme M reductase operon protein D n=1 Tax=Methanobacterium alcaliphilum TaxID=392018 RepID=UPI002009DE8D|nr:methyl-coenzyme M reductase operon protein D [Methanobacterium alcaliphilum]MCK9152594.1 methyl-coenzyme M reductase operon protein D [Methanobacterium alcaliphilum]
MDKTEKCEIIDLKIFPHRFLKVETSEKLLNKIYSLDGMVRVIVKGPSLPAMVSYGPARGEQVNHSDRKVIIVNEESMQLRLKVGEIIISVSYPELEIFMEKLDKLLNDIMPCKYDLFMGIFSKTNVTISDYLKYGRGFETKIDQRLIGMVDPSAKSSETIKMVNKI